MRFVQGGLFKQTTSKYHRGTSGHSNRGFGDSEHIIVSVSEWGTRSFSDDSGQRITDPRRLRSLRKSLHLGD